MYLRRCTGTATTAVSEALGVGGRHCERAGHTHGDDLDLRRDDAIVGLEPSQELGDDDVGVRLWCVRGADSRDPLDHIVLVLLLLQAWLNHITKLF